MIRLSRAFPVALSLAVFAASCGSPTSPTITTTTTTTTTTTSTATATLTSTDFSGTLIANQTYTNHFHAMPGVITLTMTSLPGSLVPAIGLGLGTWNSTAQTCTLVIQMTAAQQGSVVTGTASLESDFCLQVWDVNGFAPGYTQAFTVTAQYYALPTSGS